MFALRPAPQIQDGFPPCLPERIPLCFILCVTKVLHAASMTPVPMGKPCVDFRITHALLVFPEIRQLGGDVFAVWVLFSKVDQRRITFFTPPSSSGAHTKVVETPLLGVPSP